MIQSVCGSIIAEDLGFCHSHEHLFIADGQQTLINPALRIDDYSKTVEEVMMFKRYGGSSIVDAQPLGCGRMEDLLVKCSIETGIHIIASTGFHKLSFYPSHHWIHRYDESALMDIFIHELTKGMFMFTDDIEPKYFMNSKAGLIKTAIDKERQLDHDKKWFHAAARASLKTGAPIMCHVESKNQAAEIINLYQQHGVPNHKMIICHLDRELELMEYDQSIAAQGIFLEYDTIGRYKYHSDEKEALWIKKMVDNGYSDSILLGLDTTRQRFLSYGGEVGLGHLANQFLPMLLEYGVPQLAIDKMMYFNPAKAFDF